jgi:uridylate kinase
MKVRVLNANTEEAMRYYVSAGFAPSKLNDTEVSLLTRKADRTELLKAVQTSESFVNNHKDSKVMVFSGGKGRPFTVFSTN